MTRTTSRRNEREYRKWFPELHPALTSEGAAVAASKCLYCFDAPCTRACPTHIDVPQFIRQILHGDAVGAARTILDANIFGGSCARVCPTEVLCEGACVEYTHLRAPVDIGRLQRYACDTARDVSRGFYRAGEPTGRRVAIVGGGPAGLTCAHELRKRGHDVVVYEAQETLGGLNTFGIAPYKTTAEFARSEVADVLDIGVETKTKERIDGSKLLGLLDEYDAVFLGIGLGATASLNVPGENLKGVWESLEFIRQTHTKPPGKCVVGEHVLVIGGGNTAMDAANIAARLGANSVAVAYRRDVGSMPAFRHEYKLAVSNGVEFLWQSRPLRILGRGGKVTGVRLQRLKLDGRGRRAKLKPVRNSEYTQKCDMVIKALGQAPRRDLIESVPRLKLTKDRRVAADPDTGRTSVPRLFAGGDCQKGAHEEVVNAVQAGKVAARGIHEMLAR